MQKSGTCMIVCVSARSIHILSNQSVHVRVICACVCMCELPGDLSRDSRFDYCFDFCLLKWQKMCDIQLSVS